MEPEKKPLDLSALATMDEGDLHILFPDGTKTGWVWTFAGPSHPRTVEINRKQAARFMAREQAKERAQVNGKKWKGDDETADEVFERSLDYIVDRLLRWSELAVDGAPLPCTPENAREVLSDRKYGLILDQVNTFLGEERSFTKRSLKA